MSKKPPRVLDVGQCSFDHANISRLLVDEFDAEVEQAATGEEALQAVANGCFDLVLVNRVFDSDGSSGLELIRQFQSDEQTRPTPVALVSNHADAQEAAVTLGAKPGFGKNALDNPKTRDQLASLLDS